MRDNLIALGTRIRELRKKRGMVLQEFALKTGLTAGLLSKVENFRTIPSLPVLMRIASALGTDLSALFEGIPAREKKKYLLIRGDGVRRIEREESSGMCYDAMLELPLNAESLQVMTVTVQPGARRGDVTGSGDEMLYLLSGKLGYVLEGETIEMNQGDLLYFDGTLCHHPVNAGNAPAVLLVCYFLRG